MWCIDVCVDFGQTFPSASTGQLNRCRGLTLDVCVCVNRMCEVDKDSRRLRLRRQLGSSRYPHSILGSLFEFVNDLKYRFALREYVCGMFGCESVAERTY